MFAVVKTGGKQYKVAQGDVIQVEKLPGEANAKVELAEVLMLCDGGKVTAGTPFVKGAVISAEVVEQADHFQEEASSKLSPQKQSSSGIHSSENHRH